MGILERKKEPHFIIPLLVPSSSIIKIMDGNAIILNGVIDVLTALVIPLHLHPFVANYLALPTPDKVIVVNTFVQSFLVHGAVRILGGLNIKSSLARRMVILSYMTEVFAASMLFKAGVLQVGDDACMRLRYKTLDFRCVR